MIDFDYFQDMIYPFGDFIFRHMTHAETESHIIFHQHMRENGIVLEHHSHISLVRRNSVHCIFIHINRSPLNGVETDNHAEKRRFSAT